MIVEITKEQKEVLAQKMNLCVDFLKKEVQPHLTSKDKLFYDVDDKLTLVITSKELLIQEARVIYFISDICITKTWQMEKPERRKAKTYICESCPELAVEFLRNWEPVKIKLLKEVDDKIKKVNELDKFVDNFKL